MADATAIEVHKALADDTRFRLYRYLGLTGRPVSVRELSTRLSLHPNTLRPHLRRLEDAGLVTREVERKAGVGRPQTMYSAAEPHAADGRDYRLFAEILSGIVHGKRSLDRAEALAEEWGKYLVTQERPKPGATLPGRRNLAMLQEAMSGAGFDPRFRRKEGERVEILFRDCPAKELVDEHRELVCTLHRGLIRGMLAATTPPMTLEEFFPLEDRTLCRAAALG
jgi:predicted ArsR family transcriptional regulator